MSTNPFADYHLVYAVVLIALALAAAGDTLGVGKLWAKLPVVRDHTACGCADREGRASTRKGPPSHARPAGPEPIRPSGTCGPCTANPHDTTLEPGPRGPGSGGGEHMPRTVTVGLDGSPESRAAADWAAREAKLRGLPLKLVNVWSGTGAHRPGPAARPRDPPALERADTA